MIATGTNESSTANLGSANNAAFGYQSPSPPALTTTDLSKEQHYPANALWKRVDQLKRWQESDTNRESDVPRQSSKVNFQRQCVFLAACAAGEKSEILSLLAQRVDIDTANADGMTALHQACIDGNLDIVKFLHLNGANLNHQDNEGWSPLHAAASCGHLAIVRYLVEAGANIGSCTSDRELALDLADNEEVSKLLKDEMDRQGIDAEACRDYEHSLMLKQCQMLLKNHDGNSLQITDEKTGATKLHIAAAKGYDDVLELLLKLGNNPNAKDADGWTPLHAAAHWGNVQSAKSLMEAGADCDATSNSGHQVWDVCGEAMFATLLNFRTELKNRMNTMRAIGEDKSDGVSKIARSESKDPPLKTTSPTNTSTTETESDSTAATATFNNPDRNQRDVVTPHRSHTGHNGKKNERIGRLQASLRTLSEKFKQNFHELADSNRPSFHDLQQRMASLSDTPNSTNGDGRRFGEFPTASSIAKQQSSHSGGQSSRLGCVPQRDFVASRRTRFEAVLQETTPSAGSIQLQQRQVASPVRRWGSCVSSTTRPSHISSTTQPPNKPHTESRFNRDAKDALPISKPPLYNLPATRHASTTTEEPPGLPPQKVQHRTEPTSAAAAHTSALPASTSTTAANSRLYAGITAVTVSSPPPLTVTANVSVSSTSASSTPEHAAATPPSANRSAFYVPNKDEQAEAERKKRSARARRERRSTQGVSAADVAQALAQCQLEPVNSIAHSNRNRWQDSRPIDQSHPKMFCYDQGISAKARAVLISKSDDSSNAAHNELATADDPPHNKRRNRTIQRRPTGRIQIDNSKLEELGLTKAELMKLQYQDFRASSLPPPLRVHKTTQTIVTLTDSYSLQQYKMRYNDKCNENERLLTDIEQYKRELHDKEQIINRLKCAARVDHLDKKRFDFLLKDNARLRDENGTLLKVITTMSKQT